MRQQSIIITLGVIQVIILTLFGLYFYRLAHSPSRETPQLETATPSEASSKSGALDQAEKAKDALPGKNPVRQESNPSPL